eukprot:SAG31_NODE_1275_length_9050_cov_1.986929_6_plen_188_part_00
MAFAVEAQELRVDVTVERGKQVLRGNAVSSLVVKDRNELVRAGAEEGVKEHHLWHRVKGAAGVSSIAAGRTARSEEDNDFAAELDVGLNIGLELWCEGLGRERVYFDLLVLAQIERKLEVSPGAFGHPRAHLCVELAVLGHQRDRIHMRVRHVHLRRRCHAARGAGGGGARGVTGAEGLWEVERLVA